MGQSIQEKVIEALILKWEGEAIVADQRAHESGSDHDMASQYDGRAVALRQCAYDLRTGLEAAANLQALGVL